MLWYARPEPELHQCNHNEAELSQSRNNAGSVVAHYGTMVTSSHRNMIGHFHYTTASPGHLTLPTVYSMALHWSL